MIPSLDQLRDAGTLDPLDVHFARTACRLADDEHDELLLAAALASRAPGHGHVCADLRRLVTSPPADGEGAPIEDAAWPALEPWLTRIRASKLVAKDGPLHLDERGNLYPRRYWSYQDDVSRALSARAAEQLEVADPARLATRLAELFDGGLQQRAAELAVTRRLSVISGGPGTGKTHTVARIVALLQDQATEHLRVVLVAPTGKAAARLQESLREATGKLPEDLREGLQLRATTIHRRLGWRPDAPTRFRHDRDRPLPADVVICDEASMVDLPLMAKLIDAVPPEARLILLGDRDQLASVEAGAVLGDICNGEGDAPIAACLVHLEKSWRFAEAPGIGELARAINAGDADDAAAILDDETHAEVSRIDAPEGAHPDALVGDAVVAGYLDFTRAREPADALNALNRYRVLCAHRKGRFGVEAMNRLIRGRLAATGAISGRGDWYVGRPVIVTRNDYQIELFNGDVGVTLEDADGRLRVHFEGLDGAVRSFHPARLPPCETVFAMTVHKSQGSEFDEVVLMLPTRGSRILTRELVYTGITRAKARATIVSDETVLADAIGARIQRASGLRSALWGTP